MINIIKDEDLINHVKEYDVTLVGTNTYCFMQNGFPHKVILDYPYVYNINLATKYGDIRKMLKRTKRKKRKAKFISGSQYLHRYHFESL